MNNQERCRSQFCIKGADGIRGRLFTPPETADSVAKVWCPNCMAVAKQITFFTGQTAEMIRVAYKAYMDTPLPDEVKLILTQFARELVENLGEEL